MVRLHPGLERSSSRSEIIGSDLMVRIRAFNRDAAHQELGMQPVETTGYDIDGDYDGVVNELTVGDITALSIYSAGQTRPTTKLELADIGKLELTREERKSIRKGKQLLKKIGCTSCHISSLTVRDRSAKSTLLSQRDKRYLLPASAWPVSPTPEGVGQRFPLHRRTPGNSRPDALN